MKLCREKLMSREQVLMSPVRGSGHESRAGAQVVQPHTCITVMRERVERDLEANVTDGSVRHAFHVSKFRLESHALCLT